MRQIIFTLFLAIVSGYAVPAAQAGGAQPVVLVELYRVAFDPLKEISFISDEYNKFELEGSLLADSTKPFDAVLGQFGRIVQL